MRKSPAMNLGKNIGSHFVMGIRRLVLYAFKRKNSAVSRHQERNLQV